MTSSSSLVEMLKSIYSHPGGLLFTKFGSNQTTLLDLAFLDSFGRLHDRSKETPKTMKQLTRLFPNKVTIQMPQDELLLSDWKQQLDRDIETLKSQSNIASIRAVLSRVGLDCSNLDALCVKDQALTNESVEKVIGWALSHHFMQSSEVLVKDAKPVISNERQITLLSELGERKDQSQNKKKPCRACGASWNCRSEKRCGCSWWKRVLFKRRWCASESSAYKLWS